MLRSHIIAKENTDGASGNVMVGKATTQSRDFIDWSIELDKAVKSCCTIDYVRSYITYGSKR